jgi:hypothetical protein
MSGTAMPPGSTVSRYEWYQALPRAFSLMWPPEDGVHHGLWLGCIA